MTFTLQISGKLSSDETAAQRRDNDLTLTRRKVIRFGAARDDGGAEKIENVEPGDAVCLHYADGLELWMSAGELADRSARRGVARGALAEAGTYEIAPELFEQGVQRGALGGAVKALEFVGIDLAAGSAKKIAKSFEDKQFGGKLEGVYPVAPLQEGVAFGARVDGELGDGIGQPLLVFLHGTASSFSGSFGKLWDAGNTKGAALRRQLADKYANRVFALEHRSLTVSPIDNALHLVERLPMNATLHLVSHSRGGLIGELLCLAGQRGKALSDAVLEALFEDDRTQANLMGFGDASEEMKKAYGEQREQLKRLLDMLDAKNVRVTRFVRAACPAMGTTLASGKLDRWLSLLKFAGGAGIFGDLLDFILAVVKERTDPRTLPGLEAMMPGSALVRLLNLEGMQVDADLSVIAGDCEGNSLWGRTKLLITDWFFAGEHDLVVNTGSMYGGAGRSKDKARRYFTQGEQVCHFNYFVNPDTVEKLSSGLLREDGSLGGFSPILDTDRKTPARGAPQQFSGPHPVAFVLPGIMGSSLAVGNAEVWLNKKAIFRGEITGLDIGNRSVKAVAPLEDYYGDFIEFLGRTHEVLPFAYDWRVSVTESAEALHEAILKKLPEAEAGRQPIRIVAHSMGGLVARAMLANHTDTWNRLKALEGGFRLMMLGTPNYGAFQAVRLVVGQYRVANLLALVDIRHGRDALLELFSNFPGALELLPWKGERGRFATQAEWAKLRNGANESWPLPGAQALEQAKATWEVLNRAPIDKERMIYVAGWASATPCNCRVGTENNLILGSVPCVEFDATRRGDGTVTWDLGMLEGVKTWYAESADHGSLLANSDLFPAYLDLLQTGNTTRLPTSEPAKSRGAAAEPLFTRMRPDLPEGFDGLDVLGGFGPGGAPKPGRGGGRIPNVTVKITRGDLAYAENPVCVGHYQGDTVVSAEEQLDRALGNVLSNRQHMGIYPGRLGTWEIFIANDRFTKPGGALVVGLGNVGELTPGGLESALARTLSDYALQVKQWHDERFGKEKGVRSAGVSFLLVGTGAGGIEVRGSVEAILRAVKRANEKLVENKFDHQVLIDKIELLELYQDIAIQAARGLAEALLDPQLAAHFTWEPRTIHDNDGLRRILCEEAPNWWQRLEISYRKDREELRFIALTNRARAEETLLAGDLRLAKGFIRQSIAGTRRSQEISRTLFEMLLPNRLKQFAPDRRDLVLVVDEDSAAYPWELLEDRWTDGMEPPAVVSGMVRQLKSNIFRPAPAHATENRAFVVGNPLQTAFGNLPGARDEAEDVVRALSAGGFVVKQAIETAADTIMTGLHGDAYRILHLAGHGVFEKKVTRPDPCDCCRQDIPGKSKTLSGMVIGDDTYLTPGDVEQMRWVPELVFINCCHLGNTAKSRKSARKFHYLAANLATQFINMGVKAVIAAGWAVDDAAARTFATHFYQRLLAGEPFGRAVQGARKTIYDAFPLLNTWGAYQCYGDPAYVLAQTRSSVSAQARKDFYTCAELVTELENVANRAHRSNRQTDFIKPILDGLGETQKTEWLEEAEVLVALGVAYGEFGDMENAVDKLDKAVKLEKSVVSLRALEKRANFKARWAANLFRQDKSQKTREKIDKLFEEAFAELEILQKVGETVERYCLLASAWKRRAMTQENRKEQVESLKEMKTYYEKAAEHFRKDEKNKGQQYPYPSLNKWVAEILLAPDALDEETRSKLLNECQTMAEWAQRENERNFNIWNAAAIPESLLVQALARGKMKESSEEILKGYLNAKDRGASPREFASIVDQFDFLEIMLPDCIAKEQAAELRALAMAIRQHAGVGGGGPL